MNTKIVFLDRETADIGDIDFTGIESLGQVEYFKNTTEPSQIHERIADATIVITNKVYIDGAAMDAAGQLQAIQVAATGVNNVDLDAAKQRRIKVFNVSGYSAPAVAQHVFAVLLNLVTHVHRYAAAPEKWPESPFFTRLDYPISELMGKTFGIVGYGDIGKSVATIARAFGMNVVAMARDNSSKSDSGDDAIERMAIDKFFASCDVISLHCPLTDENYHMINSETLGAMKPTAILINTGRGDLVNEADLLAALSNGNIGAAALDVISEEPPPTDHPVICANLPNLFITPHSAWSSVESRQRLFDGIVENLKAMQNGEERNRVV